jgi:hypothetical protein
MLKTLATRSVIAAIPVAMVAAYAGNSFVPVPPRMAAYNYQPVAEITVDSGTVGVADSNLFFLRDDTDTIDPVAVAQHLDELQALGVDNVRIYVPWRFIEAQQGTYDWSAMDVIMNAAAERNMGVLAAINSTPQWVDPQQNSFPGAADPTIQLAAFTNFVKAFATKYGSDVSAYEIWNEANFDQYYDPISPASYTAILKAVYPALKAIDPSATVVAAGLGAGSTTAATMNPVDFVAAMYAAGAKGYFDALAFHPYQETTPFSQGNTAAYPLQQAQAMAALMASNGDYITDASGQPLLDASGNPVTKKLWITEYGLPTSNVSYATQAAYIQDFLQKWSTLAFAGPSFIYTTVDSTLTTSASENSYGIYYIDPTTGKWVAKPAAEVIAEWIAAHPGQTFDPTNPTDPTDPTGPTTPTDPVAALAALLNSFVQGIQAAVNHLVTQTLGQVVTAITQAIQSIFAAFSQPAAVVTTAAPLAMKLASVVAPVVADAAADPSTSTTADSTAAVTKSSEETATADTTDTADTTASVSATETATVPAAEATAVVAATPTATPAATETAVTATPAPASAEAAAATAAPTATASTPTAAPAATTAPTATETKGETTTTTTSSTTSAATSTSTASTKDGKTDTTTSTASGGDAKDGKGDTTHPASGGPKDGKGNASKAGDSDKPGGDTSGSEKSKPAKGSNPSGADTSGPSRHSKGKPKVGSEAAATATGATGEGGSEGGDSAG